MAQKFHPSTNTFSKATIFGAVFFVGAIAVAWGMFIRSPYVTGEGVVRPQPVPFSHEHHVRGLGIHCRYCHTAVETSSFAGMPPTHTCMTCHSQVWTDAPALEPVRESWQSGEPIAWNRVYDLPDFVYFDHSIHVAKGVGCETCHGRLDQMPLTWQAQPLHMEWCLDCHRQPEQFLRPPEEIYTMGWEPNNQAELGQELAAEYHIQQNQLTDCSICHR
ncbi:MAG: cytochrome c3 family protein [Anaerolineaceae bacterium]|nr:cytochrome c3 family protein [Anaerolineaceae bacterium]